MPPQRGALRRRMFLRASGVAIALPMLEAMRPAIAAEGAAEAPRRLVAIETNMGILPNYFFPEGSGLNYKASPYLERLAAHRDQMTVFSGTSFPGVTGGHAAERCFLTGTPHPERGGFRNGVSLDQFAADYVGNHTRFHRWSRRSRTRMPRSASAVTGHQSPRRAAPANCSRNCSCRAGRRMLRLGLNRCDRG
jgi:hypothetical protein